MLNLNQKYDNIKTKLIDNIKNYNVEYDDNEVKKK